MYWLISLRSPKEKSGFRHSFILWLNGYQTPAFFLSLDVVFYNVHFILSLTPFVVPRGLPEGPKATCQKVLKPHAFFSYSATNRGCPCTIDFAELHSYWISLGHMPNPEPITMAREMEYADWLGLGCELHCWGRGWNLIPKNYMVPQMEIRAYGKAEGGMEAGETAGQYQPASPTK